MAIREKKENNFNSNKKRALYLLIWIIAAVDLLSIVPAFLALVLVMINVKPLAVGIFVLTIMVFAKLFIAVCFLNIIAILLLLIFSRREKIELSIRERVVVYCGLIASVVVLAYSLLASTWK